jgi:hypothetical protein
VIQKLLRIQIGNSARTKILHGGYWCDTKVVCTSYWCDREVMDSGYRCVEHNLPCGVAANSKYMCTVEICARKVIWRVNNNKKPMIFRDVLYHLNVIFLQHVFEALESVFRFLMV